MPSRSATSLWVNLRVPFVAGRDWRSDESAAGIDATCVHPDDDEHLWTGHVFVEERSEWKGRRDGAQASCSERLNQRFFLLGVYGSLFEESESRKLLRDLVAGVGFEPTTFGL